MIPVFIAIFFLNEIIPFAYGIAAIVFALAACTDFVDGYIARKNNLVTNLGKFLDPIADKVLVSTAMLLILTMKNSVFDGLLGACEGIYVAVAVCVCVIMARELIISAFRQIAATNGLVLAADKLGKLKTVFQDVSIFTIIFAAGFRGTVGTVIAYIGVGLFAIATLLTVWSGISYVVKNKQVLKDN